MKDKLIEKLENRIKYFKSIHHSFEANELLTALSAIKRLMPPENFEKAEQEKEPLSADNILEKHCMGEYFMNSRYRQLKHIRSKIIEAMQEYREQGIDWEKINPLFREWYGKGGWNQTATEIIYWFKTNLN